MTRILTVLPYVNPPHETIELYKAKIIKMTEAEYFDASRNSIMHSATPPEMMRIALARQGQTVPHDYKEIFKHNVLKNGDEIGSFEWAVLETEAASPSADCYLAVFELLGGSWRSLVRDNAFMEQSPLVLVPMPRTPKEISLHTINPEDIEGLYDASKLLAESLRFQISLRSWWYSFMRREDTADIIVSCCQALEAIFVINQELRLCLALYTYHYLGGLNKKILANVFELYGLRSGIVHGSKLVKANDTKAYIEIVGDVLSKVLQDKKLPNSKELDMRIGIR